MYFFRPYYFCFQDASGHLLSPRVYTCIIMHNNIRPHRGSAAQRPLCNTIGSKARRKNNNKPAKAVHSPRRKKPSLRNNQCHSSSGAAVAVDKPCCRLPWRRRSCSRKPSRLSSGKTATVVSQTDR